MGRRRSMSLYTSENMARAKSLATGWGILCGGVAVATESMLGFAWCMRVSKLLLGGWAHLGAFPPKGISHRLFARIAEHILREAFAFRARPVYRRAPALLGDVSHAVDCHKLQVVRDCQKPLYFPPLLRHLHGRRDELDAHAELRGGEPDVLDGGAHPEDRVEPGEFAGAVLRLVQKDREDQGGAGHQLPVVLGEGLWYPESVHHRLAGVAEDLAPERPHHRGELVDVDAVPAAVHLLLGEAEVRPVALPEGALLHQAAHGLAADARHLIDDVPVVCQDEAPRLAVEVRRRHRRHLDQEALVLLAYRIRQERTVGGPAPLDDLEKLQTSPPELPARPPGSIALILPRLRADLTGAERDQAR